MLPSCLLSALLPVALAVQWPGTPFKTSGRDILDHCGDKVNFAGVNWPGHSETMIPEGLSHNSIANIMAKFKSAGFNIIRLTYSIQMIDDHFADAPTNMLSKSLDAALGADSHVVLAQVLEKNPQFNANTTRLEIFDAVAAEAAKQEMWIHLDNHQSRAAWCCPQWDGNAWFGDKSFDVYNWTRGLGFMAARARFWPALASMSLRNELRPPPGGSTAQPYDWPTWLANVIPAAEGIHGNNSLPLIFFSGLNWDYSLDFVVQGQNVNGSEFKPADYSFARKIVGEVHNYANVACVDQKRGLYESAYGAMDVANATIKNHMPIVLTEFGFDQRDGSAEQDYAQCLKDYLLHQPGGAGSWMLWVGAGSYYIKFGDHDSDETWGLLDRDWTEWRNQTVIDDHVLPFIRSTIGEN